MEETLNPFKKAGTVLLIIGILDIGAMAYCIANKISYSSSFNIFAVIAGILLIKGSVKTARIIRWVSAFFVIAFVCMAILFPISIPIELTITQIKLNPIGMLGSYAFSIVFIIVLAWIYRQLSSTKSLELLKQHGYKTGKPKSAVYAALSFMVLGIVLFLFIYNSDSANKAIELAKEQQGTNYKYHINSLNMSNGHGSAVVTAYNSTEIKNIQVQW